MDVTYTNGPRYLDDGTNLDLDVDASFPKETQLEINDSVTNLIGLGYEPGQYNKDGLNV